MLALEDLRLTQGDFTLDVNLDLETGGRLALLGASGSGKSTLLSVIAGFFWPDQGRVLIDGQDVSRAPVASRPLSILFQEGNLFPHLTVLENVALGIRPDLRLSEPQRTAIDQALGAVDLAGFGARRPGDLSGGQRSRVALARMLVRKRPLVLLDEPFAALDPGLKRDMLDLVDALCRTEGLTLVMACHDLRDAERLCDRLLLLDQGQVAARGALGDILANPPQALRPWI